MASLEEIGRAIAKAVRYTADALAAMSWPMLAATCVALALAITIIPLALGLFVIFVAVKLIFSAIADRQRGTPVAHRPVDTDAKGE